jgi:hypothetical protein
MGSEFGVGLIMFTDADGQMHGLHPDHWRDLAVNVPEMDDDEDDAPYLHVTYNTPGQTAYYPLRDKAEAERLVRYLQAAGTIWQAIRGN